ncbi:MAG: GntR family transcriptional regulator [Clostridium sp.]|nr:GntR family transcriptional regulator [Enterocloster citroniae]MCB7065059.1 GntR family transcriptional regulator [Enterocloster citroniae]MCC8083719.1 GntR family transcriptional regulator [Clostridium sp.]
MYTFDSIFTEKFLIEKYNVSRAPVREALTMMAENQILVSIPRHGYKFKQPSEGRLLKADIESILCVSPWITNTNQDRE